MNKVELLAPAGDLERLKIAFLYGADAVYIGGPVFGLRANAINFSLDELQEGVDYAHYLGKKVYVTVNIVMHNKEVGLLLDYLQELEKIKVDAIIVSDLGIANMALEKTNLQVHLSTQQSTLNKEAIKYVKKMGISRIVMAREAKREDLIDIKKNVDIELECFIHGAMCAGYSGRCVLSNYFTNRDANRGGCSQICRWDFTLLDSSKKAIRGDKDFTFCAKDLSMLRYIPDMIDIGISSFKIEGRMRSSYYIATVVGIYRRAIDEYCNEKRTYEYNKEYEKILARCANRESISQFYDGVFDYNASYYNGRDEVSNQDFLGMVVMYDDAEKMVTLEQRNYFKKGDIVEFFGPKINTLTYNIDEIFDEDNNVIKIVNHPKQIVRLKVPFTLSKGDMMRKKII